MEYYLPIAATSADLARATALAMGSGLSWAGLGAMYKLGQTRGVLPVQLALVLCLAGAAVAGARAFSGHPEIPLLVWVMAVTGGLGQYLLIKLIDKGLRMGALSAVWCSIALSFIPVFVFAAVVLGQTLGWAHYLSGGLAIGCVLLASFATRQKPQARDEAARVGSAGFLGYLLVLASALLVNSINNIGQTLLAQTQAPGSTNYWALYGDAWLFGMYGSLGLSLLLDLLARRQLPARLGPVLGLGFCAGVFSLAGQQLQGFSSTIASATTFAVTGAANIFFSGLVAVMFFKEKVTMLWCFTILLGVLSVVMGSLKV